MSDRKPYRLKCMHAMAAAAAVAFSMMGCSGNGNILPDTATLESNASGTSGATAFPSSEKKTASRAFNPFDVDYGPPPKACQVIENPTLAELMQTGSFPDMVFGSASAPVTIIEYASLTCPYCRQFHKDVFPVLKREYVDTGKVRFILREFPIGKTSGMATIALRCAPKDKYLDLYGKFLAQQASWISQEVRLDPIFAVAQQVGMKRAEFDACRQNQSMIDGLKWIKDRGRTLGIIGTPNFFIGTKLVKKVLSMDDIRALVEPKLQGRVSGGNETAPL